MPLEGAPSIQLTALIRFVSRQHPQLMQWWVTSLEMGVYITNRAKGLDMFTAMDAGDGGGCSVGYDSVIWPVQRMNSDMAEKYRSHRPRFAKNCCRCCKHAIGDWYYHHSPQGRLSPQEWDLFKGLHQPITISSNETSHPEAAEMTHSLTEWATRRDGFF